MATACLLPLHPRSQRYPQQPCARGAGVAVREHQEGAAQITAEESQPTRAGSALTGRPRDESRSTRQRLESLDSESPSREPN
jgi:hypothetical protein